MFNKLLFFLLFLYFRDVLLLDTCEGHTECRKCIQDANSCVWCASDNYKGTRCKKASPNIGWCPEADKYLQNPKNFAIADLNRNFSSEAGNVTQIKPQRYQMKLRPGQPKNFTFSFKWAKDYPVDLYFLFDASLSMELVKNHTADNSKKIYLTMKNMTNDVYLGMGSFVDKYTLPYIFNSSDLAYSFRHHLKLMEDHTKFQKAVQEIPKGKNRDLPEAGFDGLAQAIVCKKDIGWRKESRKIIIVLTNDVSHAAGDGRLGGIFQPYDGKCYTENGVYTKELEMDYPTVSTINKLAKQNDVIVIFAVTQTLNYVYQGFANSISGSKVVSLKIEEEDGIATTLKNIYEEITKKIELKVQCPKNFDISFDPDCTKGKNDNIMDCDIRKDEEQIFNGTIKLREYVGNDHATIEIANVGVYDKLTLDVEVIKDCDCVSNTVQHSKHCNGEKRECGVCICGGEKFGHQCECSKSKRDKSYNSSTCYAPGTTRECSGWGVCKCGICECNTAITGYNGVYCECDVNACPRDNENQLCSRHGTCECDRKCNCDNDWTGEACECSRSIDKCLYNGKECNSRGHCNCNSCICNDPDPTWDSRSKQDILCVLSPPERPEDQCTKLNDCVLCQLNNNTDCHCPFMEYEILNELPEDIENSSDWYICRKVRVDVGCYTNYTYKYDEDKYKIHVKLQTKKDCAAIYYYYGLILLLTLLLVGIFTLLGWKLCTDYQDRQEYLNFLKVHKDDISGPSENPLYEPASTTFRNPAFRKKSINQ